MAEVFECPWCGGKVETRALCPPCNITDGEKLETYLMREGECDTCAAGWVIDIQFMEKANV